jgi:hypothetical protein
MSENCKHRLCPIWAPCSIDESGECEICDSCDPSYVYNPDDSATEPLPRRGCSVECEQVSGVEGSGYCDCPCHG